MTRSASPAIVVIGSRPYESRVPLGDWQLARSFARLGHPVLYVDPPVHVLRLRQYRRGATIRETSPDEPPVITIRPFAFGARRPWRLSRVVTLLVGLQVRVWLLLHGWKRPIVITVAPERGIPTFMGQASLVYWQKDRQWASKVHRRPEWLTKQHQRLLVAADVATGVSPEIVADGLGIHRLVHLLPNGVESEHFQKAQPEPLQYAHLARPRIIFVGSWGWRVDKELFAALARSRPEWSFITVAPPRSQMVELDNVLNLGGRDYADLPGYLQHADVGIVPYRDEPFNAASAPLKILEYAAAGLAVVASGVLRGGAMADVRYADDLEQWLEALDEAVRLGRRGPADIAGHLWEDRCRALLRLTQHRSNESPEGSAAGATSRQALSSGH